MEQKKNNLKTISGFSSTIVNYKNSISKFLNPRYGITPEDFIETCIRAVKENPKLLQCDPKSLFGAVLLSAEVGLKPNTSLQHSYIIPYKGEAKFQIGYKGLIEIMYRNPRVKQITARAVYEKDFFEYNYGLKPDLIHRPARLDRGKLQCVYATCLVDNEPVFVVVEKSELDAIRGFSKAINTSFSPYNNGTDIHNWMEIKAGIKALSKLIPTSNNIEMAKAVEYDSRFEGGAKVMVELPNNPNDVVEPKLVDSNNFTNTFDTTFDVVDEEAQEVEELKELKEVEEKKASPESVLTTLKTPINSENNQKKEKPVISEQQASPKDDNFIWDLTSMKNETEQKEVTETLENTDDDISFDFPSDEDEGWSEND